MSSNNAKRHLKPKLTYREQQFPITIVICLIILIGLKLMAPVFKLNKTWNEIALNTEFDTHKTQNPIDTDHYSKNIEYNIANINEFSYLLWYTKVTCSLRYTIDYKSTYYYRITIPPPELGLHITV